MSKYTVPFTIYMILEVNIIGRKASIASSKGVGGSGGLSKCLWERSPLRKLLGSKEHRDWFKIDLNAVKIITDQNYKAQKN